MRLCIVFVWVITLFHSAQSKLHYLLWVYSSMVWNTWVRCVCYNTIWLYIACRTDNLNKVIRNWPTGMVWTALFRMWLRVCVQWGRWPTYRCDKISHCISVVCVVLHFTALYLQQRRRWRPNNGRPAFQVCAAAGVRSVCHTRPWSLDFKADHSLTGSWATVSSPLQAKQIQCQIMPTRVEHLGVSSDY